MKYTLSEIAVICNGRMTGHDGLFTNIITDSRSTGAFSGSLFIAIKGVNHDGHDYIPEMYRRGVRGFMLEREIDTARFPEAGFVMCGGSVEALQRLASHHRGLFGGQVAAITGSNGKTIVKEWIGQLAPSGVKIFRSPRSYNSQIGVALSLLMIEGDEQLAVIEAGISQPGEMERLEKMIRPDVGIITNIGDAHQENFRSLEEKTSEKLKLFKNSSKIIYGSALEDDILKEENLSGKELFRADPADYDLEGFPFQNSSSLQNISIALKFYEALGYDLSTILPKLPNVQGVAMRLELKEGINGSIIINDSYNCDINSLMMALDYLRTVAGDREKVLILSDITQSGLPERELCARVAEIVRSSGIDRFIGIGRSLSANMDMFEGNSLFFLTTEDFLKYHDPVLLRECAILIKGGRAFGFEKISRELEQLTHTTVLEVNLDNMIHNLNRFRSQLGPETAVMAMVKALGYGNGSFELASMLQHQKVSYLAVAFADEGAALRIAGITMPIVVLNAGDDSYDLMIKYDLEPEIYSFSSLAAFGAAVMSEGVGRYPVHIKLDTGMHRLGFVEGDMDKLLRALKEAPSLRISSVFSHLAASDEDMHDEFTAAQIELFRALSQRICDAFPEEKILRHISNSAAIERFPQARFDMVRLGIGLYGISTGGHSLLPVSTLKSRIVQIKEIPAGDTIGYGRHGKAERAIRLATIPVGYADGLDRRLSRGAWSMLVNGKPAPVIGNICMDTCMIDITGIDAVEGDQVIIFGPDEVSVSKMAETLGTIPYEIMTGISGRVKRVFVKE